MTADEFEKELREIKQRADESSAQAKMTAEGRRRAMQEEAAAFRSIAESLLTTIVEPELRAVIRVFDLDNTIRNSSNPPYTFGRATNPPKSAPKCISVVFRKSENALAMAVGIATLDDLSGASQFYANPPEYKFVPEGQFEDDLTNELRGRLKAVATEFNNRAR
jgi:hypothetical protein